MNYWPLMALAILMTGCGGHQDDDLDQFIKESGKNLKGRVEPLPEMQQFVPYVFNAKGDLPDPFMPRKAGSDGKGGQDKLKPDFKRPKEALEGFALENLKYVGTLKKGTQVTALVSAPDGQVYQIKTGNYMGQNFGLVSRITTDELVVKEVVQDPSGDWVERNVPIYPHEEKSDDKQQKK